jgi:hypothetical protein
MMEKMIAGSVTRLKSYIEARQWKGYDPYDALNSPVLRVCSLNRRLLRIAYTQTLRRLPLNLRGILMIREEYNPKAMGLFLASYITLYRTTGSEEHLNKVKFFIDWLLDNSSGGYAGLCWGYNFSWQSRAFFAPAGTPTVVNTCFVANAFLDAYEVLNNEGYLDVARSSCNFITSSLNIHKTEDEKICFSYTPLDDEKVHNANLLAASLLSRVYSLTGEDILLDYADRAVSFSAGYQNKDGSWYYGLSPKQNWVDSFHTGFVLESLYDYARFSGRSDVMGKVKSGLDFYQNNFFTKNGLPKYYDMKTYPIDTHSAAEGIIVFTRLRDMNASNLDRAKKIALWTINNMQDSRGYFYYQRRKCYCNKTQYMRWSQAWMFEALIYLAEALGIIPTIVEAAGKFTTE